MRTLRPSLVFFLICAFNALFLFLLHTHLISTKSCVRGCDVTQKTPQQLRTIPAVHSQPRNCGRERINLIYVKTHKTASDTITNILHRFGLRRNLEFVLPTSERFTLCFPYLLEPRCFRPHKTEQFNIMCQHVVYTPDVMSRIMPPDTVYITSIREPFARMKSAFRYFRLHDRPNLRGPRPLERYLADIPGVERAFKSPRNKEQRKTCLPPDYSFTRNSMAFGLGFHTGFHHGTVDQSHNATYTSEWIAALDRRFSLVMVVEYFHESLVLLRRLMCWSMLDILYIRDENQHVNKNKNVHPRLIQRINTNKKVDPRLIANFRRYNVPDYTLYDHFNWTLWRKIAAAGDDFWAEVRHFDRVIKSVERFWRTSRPHQRLTIPESPWNEAITLSPLHCGHMKKLLIQFAIDVYEATPGEKLKKQRDPPGC